jgi:serine protease Do
MKRSSFLAAVFAVLSLGNPQPAPGQSFLEKAADPIKQDAGTFLSDPGAQPGAVPTASDGIYLGMIGDDTEERGRGVRVLEVRGKGPAERGGLRAKDLITAIGDQPVGNLDDMDRALQTNKAGDRVEFKIERDGKTQTLRITLGQRPQESPLSPDLPLSDGKGGSPDPSPIPAPIKPQPQPPVLPLPDKKGLEPAPIPPLTDITDPAPTPPPRKVTPGPREAPPLLGKPSLGVTVKDVTPELRASQGLGVGYGALITALRAGSPAQVAGIPAGAVIIAIDGRRVNTAEDLVTEVRAAEIGQDIEVTYVVGERQRRVQAKLTASRPATPEDAGPAVAPPSLPGSESSPGGLRPIPERMEGAVEGPLAPGEAATPTVTADAGDVREMRRAIETMRSQVELLQQRLSELEARLQAMEKPNR